MKINNNVITYNEAEWAFIESLSEQAQKNIRRGICTPYDYGYKSRMCTTVITNIDGQKTVCNIRPHEEFIKLFNELETLMMSDDKEYWILYEEHYPETSDYYEVYWCIPTSQIDFTWNEETGWHIASGVGVIKENKRTPLQSLSMYKDFYGMLTKYYTYHADDCDINELHIACRIGTHLKDDLHKILFAEYLTEYWNAWLLDVIDGKYKYIHMINIVWESWLEYMSK